MSNSKPAKPNQEFSTKILHALPQQKAEQRAFRESIKALVSFFSYKKIEGLIAAFQGNSSTLHLCKEIIHPQYSRLARLLAS